MNQTPDVQHGDLPQVVSDQQLVHIGLDIHLRARAASTACVMTSHYCNKAT
jgi:hypothetical protein